MKLPKDSARKGFSGFGACRLSATVDYTLTESFILMLIATWNIEQAQQASAAGFPAAEYL
mgnify:CR=1 FL=1